MKKIVSIALVLCLALVCVACGGAPSSSPASASGDSKSSSNSSENIEVDKGLLDVTITLPASFFESFSTEETPYNAETFAASDTDARIKSIKANEDGSASFTISKADHKVMMKEMFDTIVNSADSLKANFPSIRGVEANDNCTEITLIVDKASYEDSFDSFAILSLQLQGAMYQAFNGTAENDVLVNIKDEASGEIFDTASLKES